MKHNAKLHDGFKLRLVAAIMWIMVFIMPRSPNDRYGTTVIEVYSLLFLITLLFIMLLLYTYPIFMFIIAFVGRKKAWANYVCIVQTPFLFTFVFLGLGNADVLQIGAIWVAGILGIIGGRNGNRVLAVQEKSDYILDKVIDARGKTAQVRVYEELFECIKKKDDEMFFAIVHRENAYYESVKEIMFTQDEAEQIIARIYNMAVVLEDKSAAKALRKQLKRDYEIRDFAKIRSVLSEYEPRYNEWINAHVKVTPPPDYVPEMDGEGGFDGWSLLCRFVNIITLFLAKPFTECWMMRWECKHTVYKGKRLSFDGNGLQLWGKYIVWWLLCIITLGIYSIFLEIRLEKWKAKHTHLAGEIAEFGGGFDGWVIQRFGWKLLCNFVNIITLFIAYPATLCWMEKWYYKHRVYDGVRLHFNGKGIQLFGKWIQWWLLSIVTLGIYSFFIPIRVAKWEAKHVELSTYKEYWGKR